MIEWVPYSDHTIKVCSKILADDRWVPLALIWKSAASNELLRTVWGEPTECCTSGKEAIVWPSERPSDGSTSIVDYTERLLKTFF